MGMRLGCNGWFLWARAMRTRKVPRWGAARGHRGGARGLIAALTLAMAVGCARLPPALTTDFERDPRAAGWSVHGPEDGAARVAWSDEQPHSGGHCLTMTPDKPRLAQNGWKSAAFPVREGQYYRLRFAARTASSAGAGLWFYGSDDRLLPGDHQSTIAPAADWTRQEIYLQAKESGVTAAAVFYPLSPAPLAVDDVVVEPVRRAVVRAWLRRLAASLPAPSAAAAPDLREVLPDTARRLARGQPLRILFFGDSIANDLSNARLELLLERACPGARVTIAFCGRGGTGWSRLQAELGACLLAHPPDLVVCLAVSEAPENVTAALQTTARRIRGDAPHAEILFVTPHVRAWQADTDRGLTFRQAVLDAGRQEGVPVLDLLSVWQAYLAAAGQPPEWLLRDTVHLNERGRYVSAQTLCRGLVPGPCRP